MDSRSRTPTVDRREFLRRSGQAGIGGLAMGLLPRARAGAEAPAAEPRVRRKVPLGRTGLEISDISFGSSRLSGDEDLVRHALERGINYFDTAETYKGGESESTLGRALQGVREKVILASKVKCGASETRERLMQALEGSLRRLKTDRIDIYFNHAVNAVARLSNPEWPEFVSKARAQGKIRFTGMSGHGGRLVECIDYAVAGDLVDVVLVGYNFGQDPAFYQKFTRAFDFVAVQPDLPRALREAREKGIGVIAMKTLRGARLNDLRPYESGGATFAQAAFRWTLSSPDVDALIVSMMSREQVDEYLGASGWEAAHSRDASLLVRYARATQATQCRYGCDACAGSCPAGVPIAEVLRTRMYASDYGDVDLGAEDYAGLGAGASPCLSCTSAPCANACPHGVEIPELTRSSHRLLRTSPRG